MEALRAQTNNKMSDIAMNTQNSIGILIKDISEPELMGNKIENNKIEIEIESKKQRRKLYKMIKEGKNEGNVQG